MRAAIAVVMRAAIAVVMRAAIAVVMRAAIAVVMRAAICRDASFAAKTRHFARPFVTRRSSLGNALVEE
jgi:hypothetical protein